MRLSKALEEFQLTKTGKSKATREWYPRMLQPMIDFLGNKKIKKVTILDLRRWHKSLEDRETKWGDQRPEVSGSLSPHTIYDHLRAARMFFGWLKKEKRLKKNPAEELELPDLPTHPRKDVPCENMEQIIEEAKKSNPRDHAITCMLAETGARIGGLESIIVGELDLTGRVIAGKKVYTALVTEKGRGGGKTRYVYFGEQTAQALLNYLRVRPQDGSGKLFVGLQGPLSRNGIYQVIKRLAERAGVTGRYNPHGWRHAWAKNALRNGSDLGTVADVLGHSDISVTRKFYACWADAELAERHQRFSWFGKDEDEDEPDEPNACAVPVS